MSWFDDLVDLGKTAFDWFTGDSIGAKLAKTAVTGYALNQVTSSIQKDNAAANKTTSNSGASSGTSSGGGTTPKEVDPGSRLQINPNPEYKIPVVYGTAILGGAITDAQLSADNLFMHYCITLCEKTGKLEIGQGADSEFFLDKVWWNGLEMKFVTSGVTAGNIATKLVDTEGNEDQRVNQLVAVYFYDGNSSNPRVITGYTNGSQPAAYSLMPEWTINFNMSGLVFAIVIVQYSKENGITGLGDMRFKVRNTMNQPGDCIYDYMTNPIYGAGLQPSEVNGL